MPKLLSSSPPLRLISIALVLVLCISLPSLLSQAQFAPLMFSSHINFSSPKENIFSHNSTNVVAHDQQYRLVFINNTKSNQIQYAHNSTLIHMSPEQRVLLSESCDDHLEPHDFPLRIPPSSLPTVLRDYIVWHRKQRECLASNTCITTPKLLVWRCPKQYRCAGIGNRLDGLIFSLMFAVATKRLFFVHWHPLPFPLSSLLSPAMINWRLPANIPHNESWPELQWHTCISHKRPCLNGSIFMPNVTHLPWFDNGDNKPDFNLSSSDFISRLNHKPIVAMSMRLATLWPFGLNAYFGGRFTKLVDTDEKENKMRRKLMHMLFIPSDGLREKMEKKGIRKRYIGVHIRTGLDIGEWRSERFKNIIGHLNETATEILKCIGHRREVKNIYLATDSKQFKKLFQEKARKLKIGVSTTDERSIHIDHFDGKSVKKERWKCDAIQVVYLDLVMLAGAEKIFTTGSSFSNTAMLLGNARRLHTWDVMKSSREQCEAF